MKSNGFSILEVLVAAAMMGAVALGVAKLTKDQAKSTKTIESRFEYNAILSDIRQTLSDSESCKATFGNQLANNTPAGVVTKIVRATPTGTLDKYPSDITGNGTFYGNGTVKIISYRLSMAGGETGIGMVPASNEGTTNLIVTLSFGNKDRTYNAPTIERRTKINVTTVSDTDLRIVDCASIGSGSGNFVKIIGDTMTGDLIMADGTGIEFLSDRRLKYNVHSIPKSLKQVNRLNPVTFNWIINDKKTYGFIAQEIQTQFPLLVKEGEDGFKRVDYTQMTPLLVKSIQELDEENRLLKKEIKELRQEQMKLRELIQEVRKK